MLATEDISSNCKITLSFLDRIDNESGRLKGQLKLSMIYQKGVFCVMVHHARGLPRLANNQEPSTYVKVYLQPDIQKNTKRKTKVVRKNCHPSFMEMVSNERNSLVDPLHVNLNHFLTIVFSRNIQKNYVFL